MHPRVADYWSWQEDQIICLLCPHGCRLLQSGQSGLCRARQRQGRELIARSYGEIAALALDPVEKKPLYHFFPGRQLLSVGSWGCNLSCRHCQNWQISQRRSCQEEMTPEQLAHVTQAAAVRGDVCGVAYTYNEPLVGMEFVVETAAKVRELGLCNALISNGYVNPGPLRELLPWLDAANIDIKGYSEEFYRQICGGSLAPVIASVETLLEAGVHVELTWLVIPGQNDAPVDVQGLVSWLLGLGVEVPLHLTAYFPRHQAHWPPTPLSCLDALRRQLAEVLPFVYTGNTGRPGDQDIYCPDCGQLLVARKGACSFPGLNGSRCIPCGRNLPGRGFFVKNAGKDLRSDDDVL